MRDQDVEPKFSWPLALFVSGISFVAFFYLLEKLKDSPPRIFLWIGVTSLFLAVGCSIGYLFTKRD
jgi:hypothetical protein